MSGKFGTWATVASAMSPTHRSSASRPSRPQPEDFASRLSNSLFGDETSPSSVVQTGVKSFGCENGMPHPSPSHSWNWMRALGAFPP